MKIRKSKNNSRKVIISIIIIVLITIVFVVFGKDYFYNRDETDTGINYDAPTSEQKKAGDETKNEFLLKPGTEQSSSSSPEDSKEVEMEITSVNQTSNMVKIRTLIQTIEAGQCTLKLSRTNYDTLERSAATQALPSFSTCQGFDLPLSELDTGEWRLSIVFEGSTKRGSVSQSVEVQ